ncbi:MAG: hypothetical protein ACOYXT_01060, partial [Bacteroidota bacterium]
MRFYIDLVKYKMKMDQAIDLIFHFLMRGFFLFLASVNVIHLNSERTWRGGEQQLAYLLEELSKHNVSNIVCCRHGSALEKYCQ